MRRLPWLTATARQIVPETARARTIVLDVDGWTGHRAGQHVDVRLTAEDGYQAERSYSISSAPEDPVVEITVDRVDGGEAGGSGLAPLMSMLHHRAVRVSAVQTHVLVSARAADEALYREELARLQPRDGLRLEHTYTREAPPGWTGWSRRVDAAMIAAVSPGADARAFVCGPTPFVERVNELLVAGGHDPYRIHAERFGPTGGR